MASSAVMRVKPNKVAAICYRLRRGSVEFLLVKTKSGKWTFPKGNIEPDLEMHESAELEAYEEAGVVGRVSKYCLDSYVQAKKDCRTLGSGRHDLVAAFLLRVEQRVPLLEQHREPTWFRTGKSKSRLGEGRGKRERREFERVVELASEAVYRSFGRRSSEFAEKKRIRMARA